MKLPTLKNILFLLYGKLHFLGFGLPVSWHNSFFYRIGFRSKQYTITMIYFSTLSNSTSNAWVKFVQEFKIMIFLPFVLHDATDKGLNKFDKQNLAVTLSKI